MDKLQAWLALILEPLCDADPSALARYVLALLKKDKAVNELSQCMNEQLDVFLGHETRPFLERLFSAIETEEYLKAGNTLTTVLQPTVPVVAQSITLENKECTPPLTEISLKDMVEPIVENASPILSPVVSPMSKSQESSPGKTVTDARETRHRRTSLRSRSRSIEEKRVRSRSRDRRIAEREKSGRQFRNKSPPPNERRRYDRRGDKSAKSFGRNAQSPSKSRSRSPGHRKLSRSISPSSDLPKAKRQRCRDFDEKGYCMRGETCPWDHGTDPVVLEDINNPTLMSIQSRPHVRGGGEYSPDAPEIWNRNEFGPRGSSRDGPPGIFPRNPLGFRSVPPFVFPLNTSATTPLQRELISVPVLDAGSGGDASTQAKRRYELEDTVAVAEGPPKRKLPINSRLGPRVGIQQNCSLELRKVPRGLNSIAHLNNHFSKFGKIVNIQITYDGDPEAAIVTFSTHAEANVAYRSTEAVLNNRFIKVFWHAPGGTHEHAAAKDENAAPFRKTNQYSLNNVPAVPIPATTDATTTPIAVTPVPVATTVAPTTNTTAAAAVRARNIRVNRAATEIIRKKQEDQVKAAVQLAHGLHIKKHDLLQEYLKKMRELVDMIEKLDNNDVNRTKILATVKDLQAKIDTLNKEIAVEQAQMSAQMQPQPTVRKSKEQQKKELLDIELELIAQQQEGNDTTAIQKRIEELQKSLGTATTKSHFVSRNARVRPAPPGSTSVDRRPTSLQIVGFAVEDSDTVLGHFKHFGEITKNQLDKTVPLLVISYATRLNAEQAILRGRTFKDKQLQISWAVPNTMQPKKLDDTNGNNSDILSSEDGPQSRIEDEEEEEESEDRSWRR